VNRRRSIDKGTKTILVDDARSGKSFPRTTPIKSPTHWRHGIKKFSSFGLVQDGIRSVELVVEVCDCQGLDVCSFNFVEKKEFELIRKPDRSGF